ncbi:hypothetical protein ILYODFUR_026182 [Ilyodon furcidens]|uniref:Uncharacterized protein n=1 Tax=Ilyodon furcidens TaxID=33524 RepID=A0ABV0U8X0_9TELE
MNVCMVVCVLPCDGPVTCPGCAPPFAHGLLEMGTSFPVTHYGIRGILSATGNGYVIYMTIKRKTKLKPPELMTVNLAIFDFGISGYLTSFCLTLDDVEIRALWGPYHHFQ